MLKAIAIDDEPVALDVLKRLTEKVTFVDMVGYFTDPREGLSYLKSNPVDLIFLDIQMPDQSGLDLLRSIANPPMVIFTTAYSEHAVAGFDMDAIDYLLKPFSLIRFLKACQKAYARRALNTNATAVTARDSFVYIRSGYENVRVGFADILYAEAYGNYVQLVLEHKRILTRLTMSEAEALLADQGFLRIHRSFIVSTRHIQRYDKKNIRINETDLPIGPRYLADLEKVIPPRNKLTMKRQMLILLAFGLALMSCAQKNVHEKANEIDKLLTYQERLNKFNGAALVTQGGKVILAKGYGYRDAGTGVLNDTSSIFQIYSITKTFTSTMIFKLIEQRQLALDDRLSKFYADFPNGDQISIEQLLTHTSGINDESPADAPQTEAYRVALFGKNKPHFAPGDGWSYCNGGYQLLGYIIQRVTGMSYESAIRKHIFGPLGMNHSGFDFKRLASPNKVTAYRIFTNDHKEVAELYDSLGPFAAGAIYSTVGDLHKYYKSFEMHRIISAASSAIAFSPSSTNKGYGHGWQLSSGFLKPDVISHSGGALGFRSNFAMIPNEDIGIILLNNHENANPEYLTQQIIELLKGEPFEPVREVTLKSSDLEKLVGAFSMKDPQMMLYTSVVDGRLAIDVGGQGKTVLVAENENTFRQDEADATLIFKRDDQDVYSTLEIKQGWFHTMRAARIISSWGLVGDATSKGWEDTVPDIKLVEDNVRRGLWKLQGITLKRGEMKFRLDNDWSVNYGDNQADSIPDLQGRNIPVEAGVYDIELDLTDEARPRYGILKRE